MIANKPKQNYLWICATSGQSFWAHNLKELRTKVSGSCSIMYRDCAETGRPVAVGYVIGGRWLERFMASPMSSRARGKTSLQPV